MMRQFELPSLSELLAFEEDALVSDPAPEWFVPALKSLRDAEADDDDDGFGFRSLLEEPEALSKAWEATGAGGSRKRTGRRAARSLAQQVSSRLKDA